MKEPFMNHMFPKNYMPPSKRNYVARTVDVTIYSQYEKYQTDDDMHYCKYCDKELDYNSDTDEYKDCDCKDAQDDQTGFPKLSRITLQTILDMLPEGVKTSDVKMSLNLDVGDMGVYGHEIVFFIQKDF